MYGIMPWSGMGGKGITWHARKKRRGEGKGKKWERMIWKKRKMEHRIKKEEEVRDREEGKYMEEKRKGKGGNGNL